MLVLCVIGAYGDNTRLFDVWVMLGAGVVGYLMRKYQYEPASLIVGPVLGPVMERSRRQTLIISRGNPGRLWESPICMALWAGVLIAAVLDPLAKVSVVSGCPSRLHRFPRLLGLTSLTLRPISWVPRPPPAGLRLPPVNTSHTPQANFVVTGPRLKQSLRHPRPAPDRRTAPSGPMSWYPII